ncbi:hypothetical protein E2C01_056398 [Portunus trituberculatus]|uniref:Uncharacterized protein n=1 Tax=Portunus trituberculatus TaxID=210409 RepID=A0A5B7H0F2_PORTR|nr:hypothetical protein [Portunus trituberculatus]
MKHNLKIPAYSSKYTKTATFPHKFHRSDEARAGMNNTMTFSDLQAVYNADFTLRSTSVHHRGMSGAHGDE